MCEMNARAQLFCPFTMRFNDSAISVVHIGVINGLGSTMTATKYMVLLANGDQLNDREFFSVKDAEVYVDDCKEGIDPEEAARIFDGARIVLVGAEG